MLSKSSGISASPPLLAHMVLGPSSVRDCFPWLSDSVATHSPSTSYGNRGHLKALTLSSPWRCRHASLYPPDRAGHNTESGPLASSLPPPVHVPIAEDHGFQVAKFSSFTSTSDIYGSVNIYQANVFQALCPMSLIVIHMIVYVRQDNHSHRVLQT